ncbi:MAG TPA: sialidase family protein [Gaiellaceae bacterium]
MAEFLGCRRWMPVALLALAVALVTGASASGSISLARVSADPFTTTTNQHATEVEPDTFAHGSTVVAAFQVGRFFDGGANDIGYARSGDGGATWSTSSFIPGLTYDSGDFSDQSSTFQRVSDASVAYDAKHGVWLISSIPLTAAPIVVPTVYVSRSTDDGKTFPTTVTIPPPAKKDDLDKNWTVCDNTASSPFFGRCYTEFDSPGEGDLEYMSTSSDGGLTWSAPVSPAGSPHGLGGQPIVQPNGTVVVPFESLKGTIGVFQSSDGGQTWSHERPIAKIAFHAVAGGLRTIPLPSAEIDGSGRVYVAWEDCRFRVKCATNDIVFSTSDDGVNWSAVERVPIDDVSSGADHFIPGLGVDPATSGSGAHLALTYYYYPNGACTTATCQLDVGYVSSPDGGAHWSSPTQLAGPMSLSDIALTTSGPMVADYISTSFAGGTAATVFAVGLPHTGTTFDEGIWAPSAPLTVASAAQATNLASAAGVQASTGGGANEVVLHQRDN